jgi:hypothetical protein
MYSPTYAIRFMESLEKMDLGLPIFYIFDAAKSRGNGNPKLDKLPLITDEQHQEDSKSFLSYFNAPAESKRGIWQMAGENRSFPKGHYKADYGLARLHNEFNVVLISSDKFRTEIELGWFHFPEKMMHFGFERDESSSEIEFNFYNHEGRPGGARIQDLVDDDLDRIEIARESANLLMLELVSPPGMVTRARPRIKLQRETRTPPTPTPAHRELPVSSDLPLLTLFSMQNWSRHKNQRVAVLGRYFSDNNSSSPILRWIGPRFDIPMRGEWTNQSLEIIDGSFVRVEGLLQANDDGSWLLSDVMQVQPIPVDDAFPQLVIRPERKQPRFVSWERALWKLRTKVQPASSTHGEDPGVSRENLKSFSTPNEPNEVLEVVSVSGVCLYDHHLKVKPRDHFSIGYSIEPKDAGDKRVTWSSSNPSVVRVDANGSLVAVQTGASTVTIQAVDGGHSDYATIDVLKDEISESPRIVPPDESTVVATKQINESSPPMRVDTDDPSVAESIDVVNIISLNEDEEHWDIPTIGSGNTRKRLVVVFALVGAVAAALVAILS